MKRGLPLLFLWLLSSVISAQNIPAFSDADYQRVLRNNPRVLFYSVSPSMPLSVDGLKEIGSAAEDLRARLVVVVDPVATAKEIAGINHPGIRVQKSSALRTRGLELHYPSVIVANNQRVSQAPIAGFKSREAYVALIADELKLQWKEEFRAVSNMPVPRPMASFFKPIYGTDLIASGNAHPNYILHLGTGRSFDIPNDDWGDPGASRDGEFVTLLGHKGLSWFSTADILAGKPLLLLMDPGLKTYQSMGRLRAGLHRVLGAVSSSTRPAGLIVRDYEKRGRPDGGATISPVGDWRALCEGKAIAIPMMSKTGQYLSGAFEGTMRVFRIGPDASECTEIFDSKITTGKADFSADDHYLLFVSRSPQPETQVEVDAIFLADLATRTAKPIYHAAPDGRLFFPGFMSEDRLVVYNETSKNLTIVERTRRILD